MGWKFWQSNYDSVPEREKSKSKLPKPMEMTTQIGQYLVAQERVDPDLVWPLKCVLRPHPENKTCFCFQVFYDSFAQTAHVSVADYDSLDAHSDLIIYHGRYDKRFNQIKIANNGFLLQEGPLYKLINTPL